MALAALTERAEAAGIEALALSPRTGDFNEDLHAYGLDALGRHCTSSSRRRTSFASCAMERPGRGDGWRFWAVLADPAKPMLDKAPPA
jgi:hypothetical protein